MNTWGVHGAGVNAALMNMVDHGILAKIGPGQGEDIILPTGKTILVISYSKNVTRAFLIRRDLSDLKTDYLIIIMNLESVSGANMYVIPIQHVKNVADNSPDPKTREDNFFINIDECDEHADNYDVVRDE